MNDESPVLFEKLLTNFSEELLQSFIPKSALEFIKSLNSDDEVEDEIDNEENSLKQKLIRIVSTTLDSDFIFNPELRNKLIGSLKPEELVQLFADSDSELLRNIRPKHYDLVQKWAGENLQSFAQKLGMIHAYNAGLEQPKETENIAYVDPFYPLYDYQARMVNEILSGFEGTSKRQLLHLPTGAGKTRTAMNVIAEHLRASSTNLVLWLADREELCDQAFEEFQTAWRYLGSHAAKAYGFYSDSSESLSGIDSGFVVAGLQKILSIKRNENRQYQLLYKELLKNVTLVVFDEAHKAVAATYKEIIEDFLGDDGFEANLLGLTATPGRSFSLEGYTDEDRKLSDFFHNNKITMEVPGYYSPVEYLVENQYLSKAQFKPLFYEHSSILAYELSDRGGNQTLKALAENVERNKSILKTVEKECLKGSSTIVFSCTVEHAIGLAAALAANGVNAASITGADTKESRRWKIEQYKTGALQVLTNFGVLTAGFDAPITNVAVIARPMNSLVEYLQMAGRAMRGKRSGGNKECRIYTVMDEIPQFQSISLGSQHWNEMWVN